MNICVRQDEDECTDPGLELAPVCTEECTQLVNSHWADCLGLAVINEGGCDVGCGEEVCDVNNTTRLRLDTDDSMVQHLEACEDESVMCPIYLNQVCNDSGKLYDNLCVLTQFGDTLGTLEDCGRALCPGIDRLSLAPVCGKNRKIY